MGLQVLRCGSTGTQMWEYRYSDVGVQVFIFGSTVTDGEILSAELFQLTEC